MSDLQMSLATMGDTGAYSLLDPERDAIKGLLAALGGKVAPTDLNKITLTLQGKWLVQSPAGESLVDTVEGILIYHNIYRSFYRETFDQTGGGNVPDCSSNDGIQGHGDPGVACADCPFNEWGSAGTAYGSQSRGRACKEYWHAYLWRAGKRRPELLQVPASSMNNIRGYLMGLLDMPELDALSADSMPVPMLGVVTRFSLVKPAKGKGVRVVPSVAGVLPAEKWPLSMRAYAFVQSMVQSTPLASEPGASRPERSAGANTQPLRPVAPVARPQRPEPPIEAYDDPPSAPSRPASVRPSQRAKAPSDDRPAVVVRPDWEQPSKPKKPIFVPTPAEDNDLIDI